jgi:hypothetical protein
MAFNPGKDRNMIASLKRVMENAWFGQDVRTRAQAPNILNGEFLLGVNAAGTGTVNLLGVDSNNAVVLPSGGPLGALVVSLTTAQLEAMFGTPVPIIPAPAANQAIIAKEAVLEMIPGTVAFTGGGAVELVYHGGSTSAVTGSVPASVVTAAGSSPTTITELGQGVGSNGLSVPVGVGVDITNLTAAFATGNGSAKVHIWYSIITL